jgi:hypothetical protein
LSRGGEGIPRRLGAGESFLELIEELWGEGPRLVQDGGFKSVEDIDARVAADGDSKISGDRSPGSLPIGAVTGMDRRQRKHAEDIRGVQPGLSGGASREKGAGNGVRGPAQKAAAVGIGRVRPGQLELQVIREGIAGLIWREPQLVGWGRSGLRREVCRFDFRRGAVCLKRRLRRRGSIRQRLPGMGLRALDLRRVGAGGLRFLMHVSGSGALAERGARREEEKRDDPVWRSSRHPSLFPRCS